jgi:site-specific recombinase XerD
MRTQKEILRDNVLTAMKPYLDAVAMDMLNQVMVQVLFNVNVVEMGETLPATRENTNEYIMELFCAKKAPKLSQETARYYIRSMKNFMATINKSLLDVTDMDIEYYLQQYARKGNKTVTVNNERRVISAFFTWMRKSHLVNENPAESIEKYAEVEMPIDHMEDFEMEALRDACKVQTVNKVTQMEEYRECLRDRALIEFLRSTAVRIGECTSVNIQDINWETGDILIYGQKGRAYRTVCLDDTARFHLRKYIDSRNDNDPALFVQLKAPHTRMQRSGLRAAIKKIAERSILTRNVYPHLFRKTTATNMARRGCPGELIAMYLGHKSTAVTNKHYAYRSPEQVKAAFMQYGAA